MCTHRRASLIQLAYKFLVLFRHSRLRIVLTRHFRLQQKKLLALGHTHTVTYNLAVTCRRVWIHSGWTVLSGCSTLCWSLYCVYTRRRSCSELSSNRFLTFAAVQSINHSIISHSANISSHNIGDVSVRYDWIIDWWNFMSSANRRLMIQKSQSMRYQTTVFSMCRIELPSWAERQSNDSEFQTDGELTPKGWRAKAFADSASAFRCTHRPINRVATLFIGLWVYWQ